MALIIQKYGGTSVGTIERIIAVAHHIKKTVEKGNNVVVVVSAMGDETDKLLSLAKSISSTPSQREVDMLLTAGERISMSLLSIALHDQAIPSISLTGSQSGILTDAHHGNARIHKILGDRIRGGLIDNKVVIVAGFQGICLHNKEITTLGRGGSDLTAIALAQALDADLCEIYKDVDGIFSADPRAVPSAIKIEQLSLSSLLELTWSGANVLHARAAFLAKKFNVPLLIRSSFNLDTQGTHIVAKKQEKEPSEMESIVISAIAHKSSQTIIKIQTHQNSTFQKGLKWLWSQGESPLVCHQTLGDASTYYITYVVDHIVADGLLSYLASQNQQSETFISFDIVNNISTITVVGEGFWQDPEFVSNIHSTIKVPVEYFESKNTAITICLQNDALNQTINTLHDFLFNRG